MDAAMKIYEEEGYHSITMEKIAERSELSRAALYLYFKNKDEILIDAIVGHANYFIGLLQKVYDERDSLKKDILDRLWECFQMFYAKNPIRFTAWQLLHQSEMIGGLAPELRNILYEWGARVVALQHKIVAYGVQERIFIERDYRTLSAVIWSTFLGIVYVERSKIVLSHKNHMPVTHDLAREILARGILSQPEKVVKAKSPVRK